MKTPSLSESRSVKKKTKPMIATLRRNFAKFRNISINDVRSPEAILLVRLLKVTVVCVIKDSEAAGKMDCIKLWESNAERTLKISKICWTIIGVINHNGTKMIIIAITLVIAADVFLS